jgi:hypothetical protein
MSTSFKGGGFNSSNLEILNPSIIDEVRMWTDLLDVLVKGLPVPFNPAKMVQKIRQEMNKNPKYEQDYEHLLKCCYDIDQINEVKQFKPMIQVILKRIVDICQLDIDYIYLTD